MARVEERERSGTELGKPGARQFASSVVYEDHRMVALSTAHLKPETVAALSKPGVYPCGPLVAPFEEGLIVSCLLGTPAEHDDLEAVRVWARDRGYGYALVDRDAGEVDGLPLYEW